MNLSKRTYRLFFCFLFGLMLLGTETGLAQLSGYRYRKQITIQSSQVQSSLNDFPVLISITDSDLANNAQNANGYDIRFAANADGSNPLDQQIESYNASTGKLVAWVKVSNLSGSSNTPVYMFYDKTGVTSNPSSTATWDNNFKMVQHFISTSLLDATNNNNNGTNNNTTTITGKIGGARDFSGNNQNITVGDANSLDITGQITISLWVYYEGNNDQPDLITKGDYTSAYSTWINNDETLIFPLNGDNVQSNGSINQNTWQYLTFTKDNSGRHIYINGNLDASDNFTNAIDQNNNDLNVGTTQYNYEGGMDEVRLSNVARSANWIRTEYNNQNNPGNFYTVGAQQFTETTPPGAPQNVSATAIPGGDINISFDDVDEAGSLQSGVASYSVKRSTTSGGPYTSAGTVTDDESASYTFTDNSATDGTTYYYVVTAVDNAGNESANSAEVSATADGTAPTLQTATVNAAALRLDYDETLNGGSVPATGDYAVTVNGSARSVSGVSISGDKVNLTLSSSVVQGDNVTIDYTAGANPSQDQVGNDAADLSGQTVTNNTNDTTAPGAPQNVTATAVTGAKIDVSFDDVDEASGTGVSSYSVKRSTSQGGSYTEVGTVSDDESASYTLTDNTASDGTTYYYVVTAIDAANNESANSSEVSATADGTPPTLEAATVNGTALQLDYDEALNGGSVPVAGDYTVQVNGSGRSLSNVSISNDKVNITLASGVNPGDNVTISYTAGANPVEDGTGNNAANLNNQSVTNNSDNTPPTLSSTTVNGSSLKLNYNETLDAGSAPSSGAYTVDVNGSARTITNILINGSTVKLTLDPAVAAGDNVQVSYATGANPVQDIAGNDAANFSNQTAANNTFSNSGFGPDPCPIVNGQDAGWACFDGANGGTTMDAFVGDLKIATVDAASGSQTTFAPNALQEWDSGAFAGDEYNGPHANPNGNGQNATSFDINIPGGVPSNALILALNRLRPNSGGTSYTLEAFDASNSKIAVDGWLTGQGTDGGPCTNSVNLNYTNGNTTIEFQPTVSSDPSCAASSTPVWFRITDSNVARIEVRKTVNQPDNMYLGLAVKADFGDAPNTYNTTYNSRATTPAFHLLDNGGSNPVHFGSTVDGDGNGRPNASATGDDNDAGLDSGDDEDGISSLPVLTTADMQYSVTLSCTGGGAVGGWVDFDQSDSFDFSEYASGTCSGGSVTLTWTGLSGLSTGQTYARFRIASNSAEVADPQGKAVDGEVEDYALTIQNAPQADLEVSKTVDNSTPVAGDQIQFTVKVKNNGPDDATGITISDQLPSGLTYVSSTPGQGSYSSSNGTWNVGSISAVDSTTLTITATVDNGTSGQTITNEATVSQLNETDPNLSNNDASSGITVVQAATDMAITKSVDNNNPNEGEYINFTVTATNNGPRDATNLKVVDQLPSGLSYASDTPGTGTYNSSNGIWTIGNLANGSSATLTLQGRVDQGTQGQTLTNTAGVNSVDQADDTNGNNSASVDVNVVQGGAPQCGVTPELSFSNPTLVSGSAGQVGAVYEYENVRNNVDAEVEIIAINNTTLNDFDLTTSGDASNFQPQITLNNGQPRGHIDFEIRFKQHNNSNSVFITLASSGVDVDGDGGNAKEYVGFQQLTSFTYDPNGELNPGNEGIFTTFTPQTTANAAGISVNNTDYLVYTTYTNEPQFRIRAGVISTNSSGSGPRFFSYNFDPCNVNLFGGNGQSQEIVDVGVTKSVDDNNPHTGDTIAYTVNASNNKDNTVNNVEVTDQLPNGLTFVSATPSQGTYDNTGGVWDIGNLNGQQSVSLTIQATVNSGTEGDVISNTANLTGHDGQDGNANNNSASVDLSVIDPTVTGCNEPPYFDFDNNGYTLEQGSARQAGAVYRYANVRSGIDALLKIVDIQNATLSQLDSNSGNSTANFSPLFTSNNNSTGYIDWQLTFVQAGTNTPVKQDFALSALDIDGTDDGNGNRIKDFYSFAQNQSSVIQGSGGITRNPGTPFVQFISSDYQDGNGSFDPSRIAYIVYRYTSVFKFRTGSELEGSYGDRLVDIDFRQCVNQELSPQVVNYRNADISVNKTADNTNPQVGQTVNFTITATNNGGSNPTNATELDIKDALPTGLTLVNKTPSQGSYNQTTKLWTVGTLNVGNTATLQLETKVNQNAPDNLLNKAFVKGLNQFDGNSSNDTSKVALQVSVPIKGTVFEDKTGDALTDGDANVSDATGDQRARENVIVHLFKDGGDGLADGNDDSYITSDTTGSTGKYNFQVGDNGTYWVAVASRSSGLSNGATWPEQTYAPSGGLCTDGNGSTATKTSAGPCYGGRTGAGSDDLPPGTPSGSDLANAEHVAKVTMSGSEVNGINFGFSYNVVTQTRDGDDDTGASRSVQGSLRQFIQNANTISGANIMRFVPAVAPNASGSGGNWWSVTLGSSLPAVTGPLTTIDGKAYDLNNPTSVLDPNPGSVGSGGTVGVDELNLSTFAKKEFEINLNDHAFSINASGAVNLLNAASYNGTDGVTVNQVTGGSFSRDFFGARADGTKPTGSDKVTNGVQLNGSAQISLEIKTGYIAYASNNGISSENSNASVMLNQSEIAHNALNGGSFDGADVVGSWTVQQNLFYDNGTSGSSSQNGGAGFEFGRGSGSSMGNTIVNNTLRDNPTTGISVLVETTNTTIKKNKIYNNGTVNPDGPGIKVSNRGSGGNYGIKITKNSFYDNAGVGVDIVTSSTGDGQADGVTPNDGQKVSSQPNRGLDYPIFSLVTLDGSTLHVEGYVGTPGSHLSGPFTIEIYKADDDGNNDGKITVGGSLIRPHGEGKTYLGSITTNTDGTFSEDISLPGGANLQINQFVTALTIDAGSNTSEFSTNQKVKPTGVPVSGHVYHDDNHNGTRESGEPGLPSVTVVLYNQQENNCRSVRTDASGYYKFNSVLNGDYTLIEAAGQSIPTPDVCTPAPADPDDHVSTTANTRPVTVNNLPATQDFGDFEGAKIQGTVFNDNGVGGGTAHDVTQNGGESGITGTAVNALNGSGATLAQTTTGNGGAYTLYVAKSDAPDGATVKVRETNKGNNITIGGAPGTTGGTYSKTGDQTTYTNTVGATYTGVNFADVRSSSLQTDGQKQLSPGASGFFQHQFIARTAGDVTFSTATVYNPGGANFPVNLYRDTNGNGSVDSGEPILDGSTSISVTAGQTISLIVKVDVPPGTNDGASSSTTLNASFDLASTGNPPINQNLTRTDLVNVTENNGGLSLTKSVDKAQALPGETLTYTITYTNNGDEAISSLQIDDNIPAYTNYQSAGCGTLPNNLTNCSVTTATSSSGGSITWTFDGTLAPGASGSVTFKITIQN